MICLGCGDRCKCTDPAQFLVWPLETSISRAGLADIEKAIRFYLLKKGSWVDAELENTANIIRNHLDRPPVEDDLLK